MRIHPVVSVIFKFTLILCSQHSFADEIKIAADPWCPFSCESTNEKPGVFLDVAKKVFAAHGHQVTYEKVNWARAVSDTRNGKFVAIVGALKLDAPDFIFPEESFIDQKSCFYVSKGSAWRYKDISSLSNVLLGAVQDYTYGEPLDAYIARKKNDSARIDFVAGVGTTAKLLKKMADLRNDVIVEDKSVVDYNLKNNRDLQGIKMQLAGCLPSAPMYIAFSPRNPKSKEYAKIFSEGLRKMRKTKELEAIFQSYGISREKP
ncbi:substrate-binding periplasmic protein [Bdellovibrio svalbardensis]|uniref:Transporter substrate-binding domain-containing protein n=1 Tax=Bdellovibrio svalbardensis TaxID=2972972 RepID=A0ABT6DPM0_9BACT|nr:transporter substrate-binding domain-containing protein [Bdellovibrio svalbardensis]MDG0817864.1 transporter substrate-binding domain-containing protein [Bdellovibrio svalbardensis]